MMILSVHKDDKIPFFLIGYITNVSIGAAKAAYRTWRHSTR